MKYPLLAVVGQTEHQEIDSHEALHVGGLMPISRNTEYKGKEVGRR
jgi:hypothetical protein